MQVTKLTAEEMNTTPKEHQYTEEEMQREYDYIRAEQLTKKLLEKGLISDDEYHKIMTKNRETFCPVLSALYPAEPLINGAFRGNMSPNESKVS